MATVIDALLVTLGLDTRNFQAGVRASQRGEREIQDAQRRTSDAEKKNSAVREKAVKATTDGYRKMRNELLALAGIFTAGVGIKNFIADTIGGAANLGYLSQNLNMSIERLKAFQLASERAGGSQEGMVSQLKEAADTLAELRSGGGPNANLMATTRWGAVMGVDITENDLKDGNSLLLARANIVKKLFEVDPSTASYRAREMGVMEDQVQFLRLGAAGVDELANAQLHLVTVSEEDAKKAQDLQRKYLDFTEVLQSVTKEIVVSLIPAFTELMTWLSGLAKDFAANKGEVAALGVQFVKFLKSIDVKETVKGLKEFAASVKSIADSIGEVIQRWDEWTGRAKVQTPGVDKMPGALRFGKREDLEKDNKATGRAPGAAAPSNKFTDFVDMAVARTLASFGVKSAGEYVRDKTGKDDYLVGKKVDPKDAQAYLRSLELRDGHAAGTLDTLWKLESQRGDPKWMRSPVGAKGHFGFMDPTAREYGLKNPDDFETSADAASRKMKNLMKYYKGDLAKASAAWNFGEGNVARTGMGGLPAETQKHVKGMIQGVRGGGGGNTTTVTVDKINVHTQATDAKGIARDLKPVMESWSLSGNANTGVTP